MTLEIWSLVLAKIPLLDKIVILQMWYSSILSGINHRMTFVKNAIAGTRKELIVKENEVNNGASTMVDTRWAIRGESESVQSLLLSDLYAEAKKSSPSSNVFMKVDIEGYECEAFLQSPKGN